MLDRNANIAAAAARPHGLVREGVVTGLIGAAAVAAWFLVVDTVGGRPLYTPALLGAVLAGSSDAATVAEGASRLSHAALYSVVHLLAFAALGVLATFLVHRAERTPALVALLLMLFAAVEVSFIAFVALLEVQSIGEIAWYQVAIGNVIAALVMGWYLIRNHPSVGAHFSGAYVPDDA
jgi:hypothetical protein